MPAIPFSAQYRRMRALACTTCRSDRSMCPSPGGAITRSCSSRCFLRELSGDELGEYLCCVEWVGMA